MPNALLAVLDWLIVRSRMKTDSIEALQRLKRLLESNGLKSISARSKDVLPVQTFVRT
jgi:hypothetical protein